MSDDHPSNEPDGESLDISTAPRYALLVLRGKSTPVRSEARLHLLRDHMPCDPDGHFCPLIIDQLEQDPPSLDSLKGARAFMETFSPQISFVVFLVTPERLQYALMDVNAEMLNRFLPGRYAFATSLEEAQQHVDAYHASPPRHPE